MMLTKLSERAERIPARIMEKIKIEEIDVLIGDPGPSLLCNPLPTKKNIARTKTQKRGFLRGLVCTKDKQCGNQNC